MGQIPPCGQFCDRQKSCYVLGHFFFLCPFLLGEIRYLYTKEICRDFLPSGAGTKGVASYYHEKRHDPRAGGVYHPPDAEGNAGIPRAGRPGTWLTPGPTFSTGRFQTRLISHAQRMLQNSKSAYYALVKDVVTYADHDNIATFG